MTEHASDDRTPQPGLAVLALVLRHYWRFVVAGAVAVSLLFGIVNLLKPRRYTAHTEFVPQARKQSSMAAGFAAQLGVTLPGADPTQSAVFYSMLARSPEILADVIRTGVHDRTGRAMRYATYYNVTEQDTAVAREMLVDRLAADIAASVAQKTGVVALSMRATDAGVAAGTLANVLAALERYNSMSRRSQAGAERRFAERRLEEVRGELANAEDSLRRFLQSNRDFQNSPMLTFQQARLAREVSQKQQVYASLAQAVEQARIEEVRDTPVLSVIQPPSLPARPDRRGLVTKTIITFVLSLGAAVIGLALALMAEDQFSLRLLRFPPPARQPAPRRAPG